MLTLNWNKFHKRSTEGILLEFLTLWGCSGCSEDCITAAITILTGHTSATLLASCKMADTV